MADTLRLGLIGDGISRTRAGELHRVLGGMVGLEVSYELFDLADAPQGDDRGPVDVAAQLADCRARGLRGVNVTHPYKQDAFALVRPLRPLPTGLRSVNTVLFEADGGLAGDNTDHSGYLRAWRARFGAKSAGGRAPGRVLLLGAGGVGLAMAYALAALGAAEIVVGDADPARARALVEDLAADGFAARAAGADLAAEMRAADGLVNATPLGMHGHPGCAFPAAGFGERRAGDWGWASDAVYTPARTAFLEAAEEAGLELLPGFDLFFHQGLDAFERFSGYRVDPDAALAALRGQ